MKPVNLDRRGEVWKKEESDKRSYREGGGKKRKEEKKEMHVQRDFLEKLIIYSRVSQRTSRVSI